MRLVNTNVSDAIEVVEFDDDRVPKYAILSHMWYEQEVTFRDVKDSRVVKGQGYEKIIRCCQIARARHYDYIWIDTCCIDKSSSAQLSQAINSMFQYYQNADVCFAFLSDWSPVSDSFRNSRWFRRGWTLQELLAPKEVDFYDQDWEFRGSRRALATEIEAATTIPVTILTKEMKLRHIPVGVKMSWASSRDTKYVEDIAYSLLGLFNIHMPLIYGEGSKAFLRLQEEIIRQSTDMSIFAWKDSDIQQNYTGLLATSPVQYKGMGRLQFEADALLQSRDYNITNQGIRFHMPLTQVEGSGYFLLPLNHGYAKQQNLGLYLRQVGMNLFVRARPSVLVPIEISNTAKQYSVVNRSFHVRTLSTEQSESIDGRVLRIEQPVNGTGLSVLTVEPLGSWSSTYRLLYAGHTGVFLGYLHFTAPWSDAFDTFVLVCRYADNCWTHGIVCGDDWVDIQPRFYDHFRNGLSLHGECCCTLELPHLYEEDKAKVIRTMLTNASLYIGIHDKNGRA